MNRKIDTLLRLKRINCQSERIDGFQKMVVKETSKTKTYQCGKIKIIGFEKQGIFICYPLKGGKGQEQLGVYNLKKETHKKYHNSVFSMRCVLLVESEQNTKETAEIQMVFHNEKVEEGERKR